MEAVIVSQYRGMVDSRHDCKLHNLAFEEISVHIPEQQAGLRPGQGTAVQEPQCRVSLLRSLEVPKQQAGVVPLH